MVMCARMLKKSLSGMHSFYVVVILKLAPAAKELAFYADVIPMCNARFSRKGASCCRN